MSAARAYAGSTAYPVFGDLVCPASPTDELVVTATSYSAGQAALGAVAVDVACGKGGHAVAPGLGCGGQSAYPGGQLL